MVSLRGKSWTQFASIAALLLVLALFWLWFRDYQSRENAYLRARDLRVVDAIATHVENTLTATDTALRRLAEAAATDPPAGVSPNIALLSKLRTLLRPSSRFRSIDVRSQGAGAELDSAATATADPVKLVRGSPASYVEFQQRFQRPLSPTDIVVISVQLDISDVLRTEMATDSDGQAMFSDVVVYTPDGTVVSQRDAAGGRLVKLPPDLLKASTVGFERILEREMFGEPFYVFRQLVRLPHVEKEGQRVPDLILAGVVPVARFKAVARSFSCTVQLLLLLAIVLAVMAWPFLRVLVSGAEEPLRPRHLGLVGLAGIAATAVLTLVTVDVRMYRFDRRAAMDRELVSLAKQLRERFLNEVEQAGKALDALPEGALAMDQQSHERLFSSDNFRALRSAYPYVDDVVLIGQDDRQVTKWSRGRYGTPLNRVGMRAYVRDLREGKVWTLRGGGALVADNVRSFSSGSKQTLIASFGSVGNIGSFGLPGQSRDIDPVAFPIRALSAEMVSINAPILPAGYEFAFFRDNGAVVYHSTAAKAIDENLYQELSDTRSFRRPTGSPFDTQYQGRDYRAHVIDVAGTPLKLAVLRAQAGPQTFNAHFVVRSVVLGGLLFCLECALLSLTWWRSRTRTAWCWPNPARFGRLLLAFLCATGLVTIGAAVRRLLPGQTMPITLLSALLGILACWHLLDRLPRHVLESWLRRATKMPLMRPAARRLATCVRYGASAAMTKLVYVGLLSAMLVLLGVMPTLSLADLTYRWSLEQALDAEIAHVKRAWIRRERNIAATYGQASPDIAEDRRDERRDFYGSEEFKTRILTRCPARVDHRPPAATEDLLSAGDIISSGLAAPLASIIPATRWRGSYDGATICVGNGSPLVDRDGDGAPTVAIEGETQPGLPLGAWGPWMVGIAILFGACWWAVGLFRKRIYGFLDRWPVFQRDVADGCGTTAERWKRRSVEEKDVLLRVARRELLPRRYEAAARRLVLEGLIQFQPLPRQVSAQLERYALSIPAAPCASRARGLGLSWRPIFGVSLLAAAVFIYLTQHNGSMALVTGLSSILPLLARITDVVTAGTAVKAP